MAYRKIEVDGKQYEYVVGKTHVKVKGVGVFVKETTFPKYEVEQFCDCCGEPLKALYSTHEYPQHTQVRPSVLADVIRKSLTK